MLNQKEIEDKLLSSLSLPEHLSEIVLEGITGDYFIVNKNAFSFVQKYHSKYGTIPSKQIIRSNYPDLNLIDGDIPDDERKYLIAELVKSEVQRKAISILNRGADLITQDIYGGLDYLLSKLTQVRKSDSKYCISFTDRDALSRLDSLISRKDKLSKGIQIGLKTGFSLFDDNNIGWQPGNLVSIIGRFGVGKSWLLEYTACSSYVNGHRIVYLSPEMSIEEVELRWDPIMSRFYEYEFSNEDLLLGKADIKKYEEWLRLISKENRWITMDSNHGKPFTIPAIESIVEEFSPDLLCIDGFLELRSESNKLEKNWEAMLDIAYGIKAVAQNNKIVILATSQVRRPNKDENQSDKMPTIDQIYGGDALAQASDVILTMMSNDDPNVRYIAVPKRRGGKSYTKRIKLSFEVDVGKIGS